MTPDQRRLARHALGLPNRFDRSYRNRYVTAETDPTWQAMVAAGLARCETWSRPGWSVPSALFSLTFEGAKRALDPGETLDLEDFPRDRGLADPRARQEARS